MQSSEACDELATVDSILAELQELGWMVNNMYQTGDGIWRVSLRNDAEQTCCGWGQSLSAVGALQAAMAQIDEAEALDPVEAPRAIIEKSKGPSSSGLHGVLGDLLKSPPGSSGLRRI